MAEAWQPMFAPGLGASIDRPLPIPHGWRRLLAIEPENRPAFRTVLKRLVNQFVVRFDRILVAEGSGAGLFSPAHSEPILGLMDKLADNASRAESVLMASLISRRVQSMRIIRSGNFAEPCLWIESGECSAAAHLHKPRLMPSFPGALATRSKYIHAQPFARGYALALLARRI